MTRVRAWLAVVFLAPLLVGPVSAQSTLPLTDPVETKALAVAETQSGRVVGTSADIAVTIATNGSGHVFIDTRPLTGTDMQGSARIAARVAASVTGFAMDNHDFFYVVRSESPLISGPSAGSTLALATVVALEKAHHDPGETEWNLSGDVLTTGTIAPDGSIGPVGGILQKAQAAQRAGAELYLFPQGQETFRPQSVVNGELVQGQPVQVADYCRERIGITCRSVGTLEELVRLSTGHAFEQPELGEPPTTAPYNRTLGPLAQDLIEQGQMYQDVWTELNASEIRPEGEQLVQNALRQAHEALRQARTHLAQDEFYSAASRAFSASIQGQHGDLLLTFFQEGRSLDQVASAIENAQRDVQQARQAAQGVDVTGLQDLYTVGAAQERVSQAETRIDQAWQSLNQTQVPDALFHTAWAIERAETVHWWLELGEAFGPGPALPSDVKALADEFIDLADEILTYATQVAGGTPSRAAATLEAAKRDADRGFHAGALIEASEAQVQALVQLELQAGSPSQEKVQTAREEAQLAIQKARGRAVEPILPLALFEFAGNQEQSSVALEFYRTSRVLAGLSSVLSGEGEETPSRFVGPWEPGSGDGSLVGSITAEEYRKLAVGWFLIGVVSVVVIGLIGAAVTRRGTGSRRV